MPAPAPQMQVGSMPGLLGRLAPLVLGGLYAFYPPGVLWGLIDTINVKVDAAREKEWTSDDISPQARPPLLAAPPAPPRRSTCAPRTHPRRAAAP
jgi:hypothetical protein